MKKHILIISITVMAIALLAVSSTKIIQKFGEKKQVKKINGLVMLIEFEKIEGILWWEKELDNRGLAVLVSVQENILEEYPDVFKGLAEKGYEIAGSYAEAPFWDMSYEQQYQFMKEVKDSVECVIKKPMRVFGSKYFAYDENTLKAADALGIEYILARGTKDVESIVYLPAEYKTKIISVSSITFEDMGSGSLCDYSLWARGATAEDFEKVVGESINKKPINMILVSHAYLGGTRITWWRVYENALKSDKIFWKGFNDWILNLVPLAMKNAEIPINKEVKYVAPKPAVPIEDLELIPDLDKLKTDETFCPVCF